MENKKDLILIVKDVVYKIDEIHLHKPQVHENQLNKSLVESKKRLQKSHISTTQENPEFQVCFQNAINDFEFHRYYNKSLLLNFLREQSHQESIKNILVKIFEHQNSDLSSLEYNRSDFLKLNEQEKVKDLVLFDLEKKYLKMDLIQRFMKDVNEVLLQNLILMCSSYKQSIEAAIIMRQKQIKYCQDDDAMTFFEQAAQKFLEKTGKTSKNLDLIYENLHFINLFFQICSKRFAQVPFHK